jgi:ubiquitin-conjugating enzyme E2 D
MTSSRANLRRLVNETKKLEMDKESDKEIFEVEKVDDDMFHWRATIFGPKDSLYYGYGFLLDIVLPTNYPTSPISVKFVTPIEHVNVNGQGDICMDILKNGWTSALNIRTVLVSIVSLLSAPNTDDPFNSDLAELYKKNPKEYEKKILNACKSRGISQNIKISAKKTQSLSKTTVDV